MGPNTKKTTRKQYVANRLRILKELHIAPPTQEQIDDMFDEEKMSEIAIDAIFLECIEKAE